MSPPLQWRGGILHALFKNRGSSLDSKCYRDIMLGGISGKCVSKYIRSCVFPFAQLICGNLQFGSGFDGGEACFAHLHIRLIFYFCKFNKKSAAFVFMDILTAFAVLLGRIISNEGGADELWLRRLSCSGFLRRALILFMVSLRTILS